MEEKASGAKKPFFKRAGGIVLIVALVCVLLCGGAGGYYAWWLYEQPKFHGAEIELGEALPDVGEFLTEYANPEKVTLLTEDVDLTLVGDQNLTFAHGKKEETVTLTIRDTTPPKATFRDVSATVDQKLTVEDFVVEATDLAGVTVEFAQPLTRPDSYGDVRVEILVTDANGNVTKGECMVYYVWMIKEFTMELGETLEKADLLLDPDNDEKLLDQADLDRINSSPVGSYTIISKDGSSECECVVTVKDTVAPELKLKKVSIRKDKSTNKDAFIESATDLSGEVTTRLVTKLDVSKVGTQEVVIEAEDVNGNVTTGKTTLKVVGDTSAPDFSGMSTITTQKNKTPDYEKGVSAYDNWDGKVDFTYNDSKVDLTKAGTYYVTYTAKDKAGNVETYRRKVEVEHDAADTAALVSSVASKLGSNAESIRDYVRNSISYSQSWGGSDPVWHGFKVKSGNCYVHAMCLQALLREKGFSTRLIWSVDKTHYWNMVYLNGKWWHIDATPSRMHKIYSLMNDQQRYETLSGRDWDREAWPVSE